MEPEPGRRERKKEATRRAIGDQALRLFLEQGFEKVGIRDVAAAADVAVTTLFAHFPSKEALVFTKDEEFEHRLALAVSDSTTDEPLVTTLRREIRSLVRQSTDQKAVPRWKLINSTPALVTYEGSMRLRHAESLATTLATRLGVPPTTTACRTLAWFTIDAYALARTSPDPDAALDQVFQMIEAAWAATGLDGRDESGDRPSG
jgi:AcrR family transcriptional regulator